MPAIVDPDGPDGAPISVFESGAILQYLGAQDRAVLRPRASASGCEIEEWLFWQVGGVGPMAGQAHHFLKYAPAMDPPHDLPYAKDRYRGEVARLYGVLDRRLAAATMSPATIRSPTWRSGPGRTAGRTSSRTSARFPHMAAWLERVGVAAGGGGRRGRRERPDRGT